MVWEGFILYREIDGTIAQMGIALGLSVELHFQTRHFNHNHPFNIDTYQQSMVLRH